jgi:hypothetical protein
LEIDLTRSNNISEKILNNNIYIYIKNLELFVEIKKLTSKFINC